MAVDEERRAKAVDLPRETGEVDFADRRQRQRAQVGLHVAPVVGARDVGVVQVEQQAATGACDDFADERGFVTIGGGKLDVGGRVL
ncbi:MAG: hypothetical protein AW08_02546 [Candidatus Accumulibacter adjunctus]|uniref:Uncharacterized protein n=1 Tax=Candidatus Accumulibacter adjunctus TaxID=1454001 RepID=A0A011NP87_9PROT|nr:MAG: hypothetical protein AW08_02546 [Candidatus Accumulibacter adjunctus]